MARSKVSLEDLPSARKDGNKGKEATIQSAWLARAD